ncbi:hypothetical protein BJX96DRAFT_146398 [Aspergillus floccosus]
MKVALAFLALIAASVGNPMISRRQDQCATITKACEAKQAECEAQHADTECPVDSSRFCPCYHVAKDCIKDAGCL